jgi:hypothetical protein
MLVTAVSQASEQAPVLLPQMPTADAAAHEFDDLRVLRALTAAKREPEASLDPLTVKLHDQGMLTVGRFYFEIHNGDQFVRDDKGVEIDDMQMVRDGAIGALRDMAHDALPIGDHRIFSVQVRDEKDVVILKATFTLEAQSLVKPDGQSSGE